MIITYKLCMFEDLRAILQYLFQMGNQLCPAKVLIQQFSELEKGEVNYTLLFRNCLKPNAAEYQFEHNRDLQFQIHPHHQPDKLVLQEEQPHPYLQRLKDNRTVQPKSDARTANQEEIVIEELMLDSSRYVGQTKNSLPNGEGQEFYSDGDYYKGSFVNGYKNGKGVYTFANSQKYTGQFQSNLMCGFGIFIFANGDRYEGQFVDNVRCGKGKYIPKQPNQQGIVFFEGEYRNDLKDGPGRVQYTNHEMRGVWKNGLYQFHLPNKI